MQSFVLEKTTNCSLSHMNFWRKNLINGTNIMLKIRLIFFSKFRLWNCLDFGTQRPLKVVSISTLIIRGNKEWRWFLVKTRLFRVSLGLHLLNFCVLFATTVCGYKCYIIFYVWLLLEPRFGLADLKKVRCRAILNYFWNSQSTLIFRIS